MMNFGIVPQVLNNDVTAVWTMGATIATAGATAGLVWMAWFAWKAALRTLKGQQTHAEISALKDYMNALHALARLSRGTPAAFMPPDTTGDIFTINRQSFAAYGSYVESMTHDVTVTGSIWRAYHADNAAGQFGVAEDILIQAQEWRITPRPGTEDSENVQYNMNSEFAVGIAAQALRWQARPESRAEECQALVQKMAKHWDESPCRHYGASPVNSPRRAN